MLRNLALAVLSLSLLVFIALFGRLPAFRYTYPPFLSVDSHSHARGRRTPIGFLHRALWIYIPRGLARIDSFVTGGRFLSYCTDVGKYLMYENHPVVLVNCSFWESK